uniref:Glyoxylate reductase/hydroxypyruvate reductase n=1 Tax=Sinocyclocheilus grahami TaxID=75366 RepID=A0A672SDT2_SINGR
MEKNVILYSLRSGIVFCTLYRETYEWFVQRKANFADKIQALFVWGGVIKFDQNLLKSLFNLKAVVNGGVGVDHLDIPLINSFGVKVSNTPHVVDNATADIGMSLMLASARKIVEDEGHSFSKFRDGATLGIIGMGRIGYKDEMFEMKILYHNRNRRSESDERAVGATYFASMKELLQRSDFVMVVVNLSPQMHKLIGAKEFAVMKPNSTFINISRGLVVDQDALVNALQKKMIRAAALDVTYPELLPRDHPLLSFPNVIVLPHVGIHTVETSQIMVERMVTNALAAVTGGQLPDEVKA